MTLQQTMTLAAIVYLVLLGATIYFTGATRRRVLGALAGGVAVAVVGFPVEYTAQAMGLWRYPGIDTGFGPLAMYPLFTLIFATLALIGWRVTRRYGRRGQVVFLVAIAVMGTLRDYRVAGDTMGMIAFAPGIAPVLADLAAWSGLTGLAQAVMRAFAGPARADPLARQPWTTAPWARK
jgi:hypothetical protein